MANFRNRVLISALLLAAVSFFAVVNAKPAEEAAATTTTTAAPSCEWIGHSPFCFGACRDGFVKIMSADKEPSVVNILGGQSAPEFGLACVTGEKKLCCPETTVNPLKGIVKEAKEKVGSILQSAEDKLKSLGRK